MLSLKTNISELAKQYSADKLARLAAVAQREADAAKTYTSLFPTDTDANQASAHFAQLAALFRAARELQLAEHNQPSYH